MVKILVIPDVHLKPNMFDRAEKILKSGQADFAVCLGDYVDEWEEMFNLDLYKETLKRMIKFYSDFPKTVFLIGNHDFAYIHEECGCSGHSRWASEIVCENLNELRSKCGGMYIAKRIDNVIFSHSGISKEFAEKNFSFKDIDDLIRQINSLTYDERNFWKLWGNNSPLWARPQIENVEMIDDGFIQVVGHTPTYEAEQIKNVLTTDLFSLHSYPTHPPIGIQKFVIINSKSGSWKYAEE